MNSTHVTRLGTPHATPTVKDSELDRDRSIVLTEALAQGFADTMNARFSTEATRALLDPARAAAFAELITHEPAFPYTAAVVEGCVVLAPALDKVRAPVLKDISDGVTQVCMHFAEQQKSSETAKFALSTLFQPAIYAAYGAAGMSEGAHTKYTHRSC